MTKYEDKAMSEFTVYVDSSTAYMLDIEGSIVALNSRFARSYLRMQVLAMIVWMFAFMRTWYVCAMIVGQ